MAGQLHKRLFRDTINVQRISGVQMDERGIESQTWQSHLSNVICKIDEGHSKLNGCGGIEISVFCNELRKKNDVVQN